MSISVHTNYHYTTLWNTKVETQGFAFYVAVARGYVDVASEELQGDTFLLPLGFVAVTIYVVFMLGHLTCVENRVRIIQFI